MVGPRAPDVYRRQRNSQYCGNNHPLIELERELVELHRKQAAVVFTSGYISNVTGPRSAPAIAELPHSVGRLEPQFDNRG
jgi:hypothetical protein